MKVATAAALRKLGGLEALTSAGRTIIQLNEATEITNANAYPTCAARNWAEDSTKKVPPKPPKFEAARANTTSATFARRLQTNSAHIARPTAWKAPLPAIASQTPVSKEVAGPKAQMHSATDAVIKPTAAINARGTAIATRAKSIATRRAELVIE